MSIKKNNTIDGECSNCGRCCTSILPLSQTEINFIKKYIKKHHILPNNRNANRSIFDTHYIDICPFLSETNKCLIYEARPEICKYFNCNSDGKQYFNHNDKRIINMLLEFFPKERCNNLPDISLLDKMYQDKKKKAGVK